MRNAMRGSTSDAKEGLAGCPEKGILVEQMSYCIKVIQRVCGYLQQGGLGHETVCHLHAS